MNKTSIKSGSTSTFIPGSNGKNGLRSPVTFYKYDNDVSTNKPGGNYFKAILNNKVRKIYYSYDISEPIKDDYIIYVEKNLTYNYRITGDTSVIDSSTVYKTELATKWDTQTKTSGSSEGISLIKLKLEFIQDEFVYNGFVQKMCNGTAERDDASSYFYSSVLNSTYNNLSGSSYPCFRVKINSENNNPLSTYKIQIEFNTELQSPGMDTWIAYKFKIPANISETNEKMTFRGYASNYACYGAKDSSNENPAAASLNFDNEKLDNFVVTIKDYNDGVGQYSYVSNNVYIPKIVLLNAYNYSGDHEYKYRCDMYLYINGVNGSIEKVWMRDLTDIIYEIVKDSEHTIDFKEKK